MPGNVMNGLFNDISAFLLSALLLLLYHAYLRYQVRRDPTYTIQALNVIVRTRWVERMMEIGTPDVISVHTIHNTIMAATFLATTAAILTIGVLTLSAQSGSLDLTWHTLNAFGAKQSEVFVIKLLFLLLDLITAFFSFTISIRVYNYVSYMINLPCKRKATSPQHVTEHLNRGGHYYSIGMRAFYFTVPLTFWLFGPHFMLAATIALIIALYKIDHIPKTLSQDPRD